MRRWLPVWLAIGAIAIAADAAHAQSTTWYLQLVGNSGPISEHSGTVTQGVETQTKILSYGQNLFLPIDPQGVPGALEFRPLRLLKETDGSTPRIAQALALGEAITECVLTLYQFPGTIQLYEIELGTPQIVGLSGGGDAQDGTAGAETVSILFQSLTLTDHGNGQTTTIP